MTKLLPKETRDPMTFWYPSKFLEWEKLDSSVFVHRCVSLRITNCLKGGVVRPYDTDAQWGSSHGVLGGVLVMYC